MYPFQIHIHVEPQNVTSFGNRVFADLIHYRSSDEITLGLEWAISPVTKEKREGDLDIEKHRECLYKRKEM